ncbi:hypothetical protein [Pseudomonas sp.]|uniref:hypothetical protein n=1 Tax=Pseudomonas sp. TaxID=306 RepID=UPI003D0B27A6
MISNYNEIPIEPSLVIREWLDADNRAQHKWAMAHLQRKGEIVRRTHQSDFRNLLDWGYSLKRSAKNELLIRKMKDAWRQKAYRDRQESKKPCTLVLSLETKAMLDKLAELQGASISQTVESLIRREANRRAKKTEKKKDPVAQMTTQEVVKKVSEKLAKEFFD